MPILVPWADSASAAPKGKIGDPLCPRNKGAVSRHLPRHAARVIEFARHVCRPQRRQQHRVRTHGPHRWSVHQVDGAATGAASGRDLWRHHAPRRLVPASRGRARWRLDYGDELSPSAIATATRSISSNWRDQLEARPGDLGRRRPRTCARWSNCRSDGPSVVRRRQFHPEFTSNPRTGHPLFIAYVHPALAHRRNVGAKRAEMKLCGGRRRPRPPLFLIAGPASSESRQWRRHAGQHEARRRTRHPVHSRRLRQGQPRFGQVGAGWHGRGLQAPRRRCAQGRRAGADRRATETSRRGIGRRRPADAGLSSAADRFPPRRGPAANQWNIKKASSSPRAT